MAVNTNLTRTVDINNVREHGKLTLDVQASPEECVALAKRLGILEVTQMNAHLNIKAGHKTSLIKIEGTLSAKVVQACSVSLVPVPEKISESFTETLTTDPQDLVSEDEITGDDDIPVEVIEGTTFDAGEIVTQWLALSLDPYPRSDTPFFEHTETKHSADGAQTQSPFSVLEGLKGK